jgi:hypothetical protein
MKKSVSLSVQLCLDSIFAPAAEQKQEWTQLKLLLDDPGQLIDHTVESV